MGPSDLEPGDAFGPYRLEELLGRGATGIVFRAVREADTTAVALKVLREELAGDAVFSRRFLHEARAAREVEHPHVVPVLDAGTLLGRHYLAMRFVAGRSLADKLVTEGPLPTGDIVQLAAEIGSALDALHRCGLVHRDVKPANILLDAQGTAALTDFGLAKGRAYTVLTKPGHVLGTVDYLAPEVIRGDGASPASDIYGLGCVVFACLAGRPPFAATSPFQVAVGHLGKQPPDPCALRADAPPGLPAAVLTALSKEPTARPPTLPSSLLAIAPLLASMGQPPEDPEAVMGAHRQLVARARHDVWADLPGIIAPTLVIGGRHDGQAPPERSERLASRIPGARLVLCDGGHAFLFQDPTAWPTIVEFLGEA